MQRRMIRRMNRNWFFDKLLCEFEYYCFFVVCVFIAFTVVLMIIGSFHQFSISLMEGSCQYNVSTGLDCLGCGATRSLNNLLNGHFIDAFRLNVIVPSTVVAAIAYMMISVFSQFDIEKMIYSQELFAIAINSITVLSNLMKNAERVELFNNPFCYFVVIAIAVAFIGYVFLCFGNAEICNLCATVETFVGFLGVAIAVDSLPYESCATYLMVTCLPVLGINSLTRRFMRSCVYLEKSQI